MTVSRLCVQLVAIIFVCMFDLSIAYMLGCVGIQDQHVVVIIGMSVVLLSMHV